MSLYHYLVRLETVLDSRQDIDVEVLQIDVITIGVKFQSAVSFYDGSRLSIVEELEAVGKRNFNRVNYKYHGCNSEIVSTGVLCHKRNGRLVDMSK